MNQAQLDVFRQRLQEYRTSVEEDIANLELELSGFGDESQTDITVDNHPADSADELVERERHMAMIQGLRSTLDLVSRAEQRLEAGQYGICENCGRQIAPERLEALPYATLCIECQSLQERGR